VVLGEIERGFAMIVGLDLRGDVRKRGAPLWYPQGTSEQVH
jgi:hypothetical protein